jgi:ferredoxin hydrogenase
MSVHQFTDIRIPISKDNPAIMRHEELCIKCGACRRTCEDDVAVGKLYDLKRTGDCPICIHCGQCANVCPANSITERPEYSDVKKAIGDPDKIVIFNTSPSVRVGLGEAFGLEPGAFVQEKMVAALRALGADYVLDTNFAADLTIMEEASELVDRIVNKSKPLPQFTSCCPAWVKFVETFYPDLLPHVSTAKSPIGMQGPTVKTYFAASREIDPTKIVNVAVTPCTAKKFEIRRDEMCDAAGELDIKGLRDMDHVITTRELAAWLEEEGVDFGALEGSDYDELMGAASGAGVIFGNTGGVMEAAARTAYSFVAGENPGEAFLNLTPVRGMDGVRSAEADLAGTPVRVAVAHGIANAKQVLDDLVAGNCEYDFIEVMCCRGGCIGGGGQPKTEIPMSDEIRQSRIAALYKKDDEMALRFSHENPDIIAVYEQYYDAPLSERAERMLHTMYHSRSADLGDGAVDDDAGNDAADNATAAAEEVVEEKVVEASVATQAASAAPAAAKYRCEVCGYEHTGELFDDFICPTCGVGKDKFVLVG